jgi:hypothetical protein
VRSQGHASAALPPGKKDPVPIVQEAGLAPGQVCTNAENLASPPGFDPRTIQPVVIRYTNYTPFRPIAEYVFAVTAWYFTFTQKLNSGKVASVPDSSTCLNVKTLNPMAILLFPFIKTISAIVLLFLAWI